jgi:2-haloacid dehalogenase
MFAGSVNRRKFLKLTAATVAVRALAPACSASAVPALAVKAVAFDAFAIYDPRPIFARVGELFPGHGAELGNV